MAVSQTFKVEGFAQLEEALAQLPANIARGAARRAMKRAGEVMADAQRRLAPVDDGELRDSIVVMAKTRNMTGLAEYSAALRIGKGRREASAALRKARRQGGSEGHRFELIVGAAAPHAHLVEFGTVERFHKKSGKSTGMMPADPFIRPAFDTTKDALLAQVKQELGDEIARTAKRLAKKAAKAGR